MSQLSKVLRDAEDGHGGTQLMFKCPGCGHHHGLPIGDGPGPRWGYNGNADKPTFTPSILARWRSMTDKGDADWHAWYYGGRPEPKPEFEAIESVCHSFVTDGRIQFLGDCTHALANQTVDLPGWN